MEFCSLCGKPCINGKHYKVVDVKENKAVSESLFCESLFCESCGMAYVQAAFSPKEKEDAPKKIPVKGTTTTYKFHIIKSPEELLELMLGKGIIEKPQPKAEEPPCPSCGLTADEFIKRGRFGCPMCYTHYQEMFLAMSGTFQNGAKKHVGKQPKNIVKAEKVDTIEVLKLRMVSAIEQERYEEAARLRDEIRAIEEKTSVDLPKNEQQAQ